MKKLILFYTLLAALLNINYAQEKINYTDISKSGREINRYTLDKNAVPVVISSRTAVYGTTPSWSATLERQIGGLAFGDFDNDGDLDLAAGCYFSNSFPPINEYDNMIFRNDNGTLTVNPVWFSADSRSTTDIRFGHLDDDGRTDLFSLNGDGSFAPPTIYLNSDSGITRTASITMQGGLAWGVGSCIADFDGNGKLDIAVGNQGNTNDPYRPIHYYYRTGTSTPTFPTLVSTDQMITNSVAAADMDNSDIVSVQYTILSTPNQGYKSFQVERFPVYKVDSITVNGTQVTNFTYDYATGVISLGTDVAQASRIDVYYKHPARPDVAAAKWVNFSSGVYINYQGTLSGFPGWTVGNTVSQKGIGWADYDLDGYMDLAIGGSGNSTVLYKNTAGTLGATPVWSSASTNTGAQDLLWCDVNRDGYPDLAVVHFGNRRAEIFMNNAGELETSPSWQFISTSSLNAIAFGDVNGDAMPDLAVGSARAPVVVFLNQLNPVPVEFTSFNAEMRGSVAVLSWVTASESNNHYFEIERSTADQPEWETAGRVEGSGTSAGMNSYTFTDAGIEGIRGEISYRIRQTDYDGSYTFSGVRVLTGSSPSDFIVNGNYPNPFNPSTKVKFTLPEEGLVNLTAFSIAGEEILSISKGLMKAGVHEETVDFSSVNIPSGVYLLRVTFGGKSISSSAVIKLQYLR